MNLGQLSVRQPIFAIVLSIVTMIVGGIAYFTLPVTEYPDVVPPTVVVTTNYPGASAQTVADTMATPSNRRSTASRICCICTAKPPLTAASR
jgi:multidrug efflux pump subunit AcrB